MPGALRGGVIQRILLIGQLSLQPGQDLQVTGSLRGLMRPRWLASNAFFLRIHVGKVGTGLFQLAFKKFGGVSGLLQ